MPGDDSFIAFPTDDEAKPKPNEAGEKTETSAAETPEAKTEKPELAGCPEDRAPVTMIRDFDFPAFRKTMALYPDFN